MCKKVSAAYIFLLFLTTKIPSHVSHLEMTDNDHLDDSEDSKESAKTAEMRIPDFKDFL